MNSTVDSMDSSQAAPSTPSSSIMAFLQQLGNTRKIPPLEQWNPTVCGSMDLVIKANGEWWHEGSLIKRQNMVDMFARVLWREGDEYYLKTPVEKIKIHVEDVPLVVNQVSQVVIDGKYYLHMTTTNQDEIIVDAVHPLMMRAYIHTNGNSEYRPYVRVRQQLDALIDRQAFYHLVDMGQLHQQADYVELVLRSGEQEFRLSMPM